MRSRRRIPTVCTLYMVDVLCCALGCVLLMWRTNVQMADETLADATKREEQTKRQLKEADERAALTGKLLADAEKRAGSTSDLLMETELDRDAAYLMLADLSARLDKAQTEKK